MYFAKERRGSEKLVSASNAFPGRYYTCPTCFAEVFLRRGRWRVPHFAHRSGQGKPDCENFHPSDELTYTWPGYGSSSGSTNDYRPADPLIISIELQPESTMRGKKLRAWELRLTIPKSEDGRGQITIDCGGGSKRTLSLSKLALGAQTCNVDVNAQDFGAIWVSPEVRPEYKAVVEDRIPGLDREQATLFASSTSRLKPRVDRVSWGSSYYLVWHITHDIGLPRSLVAQPLASAPQWNCALITLPDDEDSEIKTYIEEVTAVAISSQRRVFSVVYPAPCGLDILGRLILPAGEPLVVGFKQTESDSDTAIALRATAGNACAQVILEGTSRHLVNIEQDSSRAQIALRVNDAALPLIFPSSIPHTNVFPHVRFVAREMSNPGRAEAGLGTKEGSALLEKVRRGDAEFSQCTMPSGIKGVIRCRRPTEIAWSSVSIGRDEDQAIIHASPDELAHINKVLQDRRCEAEIDFGPFGIFRAYPERGSGKASAPVIPRAMRNRIRWLASTSSSFTNNRGVLFHRLSDSEIIQFVSHMHVSPQIAAHHRRVLTELQRLSSRSAGR
jgi:hypothetical protein